MNEKNKCPGRKWWMGWPAFFRVLSGAAVVVLVWLMVALKIGMASGNFTAPEIIIQSAIAFGGLVVLAFLVFWTRFWLAWLFVRIWGLLRWLLSWRIIRRCLYGLACFASLILLFYAEEDWRGRHDWEQYKRAWEAKGERFDFASFVPPPVPDDQNFALTPIVASTYGAYLDRHGHRFNPPNTNVVNRLDFSLDIPSEWPGGSINDFQGNWQLGMKADLKSCQSYYRAPVRTNWIQGYRIMTNSFPKTPQAQSPAADVLLALSKDDAVIEELRQAACLPHSRFPHDDYLPPKGWFYRNDLAIAQTYQQMLRTDAEVGRRMLSREIAERTERVASINRKHLSPYNYLTPMFNSGSSSWMLKFAFAQSSLDKARVACALERYRLAHGEYPATLDLLSPQYIEKVPHDIINDQPLHYRGTDDGQFLLYSVGWNGTDDGGITIRSEHPWEAFRDLEKGDWVWPSHPVAPPPSLQRRSGKATRSRSPNK